MLFISYQIYNPMFDEQYYSEVEVVVAPNCPNLHLAFESEEKFGDFLFID